MMILGYDVPVWLLIILMLLFLLYKYVTQYTRVFEQIGVKSDSILASNFAMFYKGVIHWEMSSFQKYGKVWGAYGGIYPNLSVADVDMLKQILVKDFSHFQNHRNVFPGDTLLCKMLSMAKDDHWRGIRHLLSPAFSTGKLKQMVGHINNCGEQFAKRLGEKAETGEDFEFRELANNFTMEAIAAVGFGIKIDTDSGEENQFLKNAKLVTQGRFLNPLLIVTIILPFLQPLMYKLGFRFLKKDVEDFFTKVTRECVAERQTDKQHHQDILQMMINAHADDDEGTQDDDAEEYMKQPEKSLASKTTLTEEEIIAQTFMFFLAGFATTSVAISFLGYNLACNPECQEKVCEEIDRLCPKGTEPTYELVKKMVYLHMCVEETLRMFPPAMATDRTCSDDITINGLHIPKDMRIMVPIYALHHNPDIWPQPDKFNPERFTAEAKKERDPCHWMPFGLGPRHCIAMRLALLETKMAAVHILQRMKFTTCDKTEIPIKIEKFRMEATNGIYLKMENRQSD